jgi:hypothetical protein
MRRFTKKLKIIQRAKSMDALRIKMKNESQKEKQLIMILSYQRRDHTETTIKITNNLRQNKICELY